MTRELRRFLIGCLLLSLGLGVGLLRLAGWSNNPGAFDGVFLLAIVLCGFGLVMVGSAIDRIKKDGERR